jgi:hypothetical protein
MIEHIQGVAGIAWRNRGMPHRAKILVTRHEAASAEMRAANGVAREAAAMSAKVPATTAKMVPAASAEAVAAATMPAAVPATMSASMATAPGECIARQRQDDGKNRNSQCAPEHGTLPAVTPPITRREC